MAVVLALYGLLRFQVIRKNGALAAFAHPGYEEWMFMLEFGLGVVLPITLVAIPAVRRTERGLVIASLFAVLGFVMYRLNVSVTGMERAAGASYVPSWMELAVSVGLVAMGFAAFGLAVNYLPIFHHEEGKAAAEHEEPLVSAESR